jgi:predicted component of type VI protein secretion system
MSDTGAFVEVHRRAGRDFVVLTGRRIVLGRDPDSDVVLSSDPAVSRVHAVLEPMGSGWCVRDLGSANGTTVNGERILAERRLNTGDEIRVGRSLLVYREEASVPGAATERIGRVPSLTARERDVLIALCRPLLAADMFTEPASTRQIADTLLVSEAAVRQHLAHLYDKFGVYEGDGHPQLRLANEAIRRGAVRLSDLRVEPDGHVAR